MLMAVPLGLPWKFSSILIQTHGGVGRRGPEPLDPAPHLLLLATDRGESSRFPGGQSPAAAGLFCAVPVQTAELDALVELGGGGLAESRVGS